jgi:hypothetical protein
MPEGGGAGWAGGYTCTISYTATLTAPFHTTQMGSAATVMTVTETGTALSAVFSSDAGLGCTLTFKDNGNDTGTLNPADTQSCDFPITTPIAANIKITFDNGGTAILSGTSLKADNLPASFSDGTGTTLGIMGMGTVSADCTHQ